MWLKVTLAILAVYRLSRMLIGENGPIDLFLKIRYLVNRGPEWLADGYNCPLCLSFWLSVIPALFFANSVGEFLLYWLGISGAVVLIYRRLE